MSFDAQGNHSLPDGTIVQTGDKVLPSQHNPAMQDISASLSAVLKRDGRDGMVGALNMGSFPITNVATSQTATNAATVGQVQSAAPLGVVADFAGSTAPAGWLLCYGQAISRTTYAALFAVIGTTYGTGDGSTTFNVPDCRGRVSAGRDDMGGTDAGRLSGFFGSIARTLGGVLGAASHVLTIAQMPSHNHGSLTGKGGKHSHSYVTATNTAGGVAAGGSTSAWNGVGGALTSESDEHDHAISLQGGGDAHPNAQPTIIFNKIIKASYA
ncbi:MAG: phage tail protein [Mesorhizobium sp.]